MTEEVREALRLLATGNPDDRRHEREQERAREWERTTIDAAARARGNVRTTAAFVDDGGLDRLRRAVEAAERRGDAAVADRGRAILATIERCRRAAADHFHSGRGTVFTDPRQDSDG